MSESFAQFMRGLSAGEEEAARRVFERYFRPLVRLAQQELGRRLGPVADPEGAVQAAYNSFFKRHKQGRLSFTGWGEVFGFLALATARKARNQRRDLTRQKRGAVPTGPLQDWQAFDREPSPLECAFLKELLAAALDGFDDKQRQAIGLSLDGWTTEEVAERVGRSSRTVQRVLHEFTARLEEAVLSE